jgi:Tol biopolymer transport system component
MKTRLMLKGLFIALLLPACSAARISAIMPAGGPDELASPTPPAVPSDSTSTRSWTELGLNGQLVFLTSSAEGQNVRAFDAGSGALTTLFAAPDYAWISDGSVAPDGQHLAMGYIPPPASSQQAFASAGLYVVSLDGTDSPQAVLQPADHNEVYSTPVWSPDGKYLYYSHLVASASDDYAPHYTLERVAYPGGEPQVLIKDAQWPSLSPDGSRLAYLALDPASQATTLSLADADGTHAAPLAGADSFPVVDSHFFSPDGQQIIFSAEVDEPTSESSSLEHLLGVGIASAHDVASDWWRVPVSGGQAERLTHITRSGLYGDFAPDGRYMAFVDTTGLYVMPPDGSEVLQLLDMPGSGIMSWVSK